MRNNKRSSLTAQDMARFSTPGKGISLQFFIVIINSHKQMPIGSEKSYSQTH